MNPEQITQIIETIKTLNLNIDSNTASEIVKTIVPYLYLLVAKDILLSIIGWAVFATVTITIVKVIFRYKREND